MKNFFVFLFMVVATVAVMAQSVPAGVPNGSTYGGSFVQNGETYEVWTDATGQVYHVCKVCKPSTPAPYSEPKIITTRDADAEFQKFYEGIKIGRLAKDDYQDGLLDGAKLASTPTTNPFGGSGYYNGQMICNQGHSGCSGSCGNNNRRDGRGLVIFDRILDHGTNLANLGVNVADFIQDRNNGGNTSRGWTGTQWSHPGNNGSGWSQFQQTDWQPVGTGSTGWTGTASPQIPSGTSWTH